MLMSLCEKLKRKRKKGSNIYNFINNYGFRLVQKMKDQRIEKDRDHENDPDLERRDRDPVTEKSDPDHVTERSVRDHVIVRSDPDHVIENDDHAQRKRLNDLEN